MDLSENKVTLNRCIIIVPIEIGIFGGYTPFSDKPISLNNTFLSWGGLKVSEHDSPNWKVQPQFVAIFDTAIHKMCK